MASTTAIFSVHRGSGRVLINGASVTFGQTVTITNNASISIIRTGGDFSVNIQNTGTEQLAMSGATIPAGGMYGGYAYRNGNFTAFVGNGGIFEALFPEGRWQDMVTSDVINNAKFFTYSGSSLVNSNVRGTKILALDTSTAVFKFVILYYDLTATQIRGFPFTYDSESGTFTYGTPTNLRAYTTTNDTTQYYIDAVLTTTSQFIIGFVSATATYQIDICLVNFSGLTLTPVTGGTSDYFHNTNSVFGAAVISPRLKYLSAGRILAIGYDSTGDDTYATVITITGNSYALTQAKIADATSTADIYAGGFEVMSETTFVTLIYDDIGGTENYRARVYSITSFSPLTIVEQSDDQILASTAIPVPGGFWDVIKLGNGNYVFNYNVSGPVRYLRLGVYASNAFTFPALINPANYLSLTPVSGAVFLTYRYNEAGEVLTKYDTTGNVLSSTTTLDLSFANMSPINVIAFGGRFVTSNIYNSNATYAIFSGTTGTLAKLASYRPVYLETETSGLIATTPGNTLAVTLYPSSTYYSHTENGRVSESNSATTGSIDDQIVTIGTTNSAGTVFTIS